MKYVIITGSVMSGIGKGITASSIGVVLKMHNHRVTAIKIDPYLNIDSGTMSPFEHGECYVLDDGGETDLDLGNYERFLDVQLTKNHNLTTGKIYQQVLNDERQGKYLGKTVQIIPHLTDAIQEWLQTTAQIPVTQDNTDQNQTNQTPEVCIIELGGTVGDFESQAFTEAIRRLRYRLPKEDTLLVNVSYIPFLDQSNETKTKPVQQGIQTLRQLGLQPDLLVLRSKQQLPNHQIQKISEFAQLPPNQILVNLDVSNIYRIPLLFEHLNLYPILQHHLHLEPKTIDIPTPFYQEWEKMAIELDRQDRPTTRIAIIGKYTDNPDSYLSLVHAIKHAGIHTHRKPHIEFIDAEQLTPESITQTLAQHQISHIIIPGGFGHRGIEGMITAAKYARQNLIPCLGICLGFQVMVIEAARNLLNYQHSNSTEFEPDTPHRVIHNQNIDNTTKGGTMRLGAQEIHIRPTTLAHQIYNKTTTQERHRHRYEVNPQFIHKFDNSQNPKLPIFSATDPTKKFMEIFELPTTEHPFYLGTQFHLEYISKPLHPHPIFTTWLQA